MLFEAAPGLYLVLTPDWRIVAVSNSYLRATMTERANVVGRGIFDVFPDNPEDPAADGVRNLRESLQRALETRQPDAMAVQKYDIRRPDYEGGGFEERYWSPVNTPVIGSDGRVRYIIHRVEDVTEFVRLKRLGSEYAHVAEALRTRAGQMESEILERSRQLAEANSHLRVMNEGLGRLHDEVAAMMAGAELKGTEARPLTRLSPEETLERLGQLIATRNDLEEQLRQSQKMEAVGRLAGGVAHDFNNLLTVILGNVGFAREELTEGPVLDSLQEVQKAAERAASLTKQLLAFSRKQMLQPRVLDCNAVVTDMEVMLRRLIGEDISLVTVLGRGVGKVRVDRTQLEQVIMNLAVNARDAMPDGGRLVIETGVVRLHSHQVRALPKGLYVTMTVTDTGSGIDEATATRMFEPFFTTKEVGKGTGLGLSTVHGIVEQSGGAVVVDSSPGKGASFRVYLPALAAPETADEDEHPGARRAQPIGAVLIVEDEAPLRSMVARILQRAGYRTVEAANGEEALALARTRPVELLLTDVVMPGMNGVELAERLCRERGEASILFTSGYDRELLARRAAPGANFLPKPFTPQALLAKVGEILGTRGSQSDTEGRSLSKPRLRGRML